jgi:hypothetical protein
MDYHHFLYKISLQNISKLYKNCNIKIKVRKKSTAVDYTTGVHQGDNMSPVLFLFVIQAFSEMLKINAQPIIYSYSQKTKMETSRPSWGDS